MLNSFNRCLGHSYIIFFKVSVQTFYPFKNLSLIELEVFFIYHGYHFWFRYMFWNNFSQFVTCLLILLMLFLMSRCLYKFNEAQIYQLFFLLLLLVSVLRILSLPLNNEDILLCFLLKALRF